MKKTIEMINQALKKVLMYFMLLTSLGFMAFQTNAQYYYEDFDGTQNDWYDYYSDPSMVGTMPINTDNTYRSYSGECLIAGRPYMGPSGLSGAAKDFTSLLAGTISFQVYSYNFGGTPVVAIKYQNNIDTLYLNKSFYSEDNWHQIIINNAYKYGPNFTIIVGSSNPPNAWGFGAGCITMIDDLEILPINTDYNFTALDVNFPATKETCKLCTEKIAVRIANHGLKSIPPGDTLNLYYKVNNGSVVHENHILIDSFKPYADSIIYYTTPYNFYTENFIEIKSWVKYARDTMPYGDTSWAYQLQLDTNWLDTFPYIDNVEGSIQLFPFKWSNTNWQKTSGGTGSPNTGPVSNHTTKGIYYYYLESDNDDQATLTSPCLQLKNMTFPYLEFWYHMYGDDVDYLAVNSHSRGIENEIFRINGQQHKSENDFWSKAEIDLVNSDFYEVPGVVKLRVIGKSSGEYGDIAIDDIRVFDKCSEVGGTKPVIDFLLPDSVFVGAPFTITNSFPASYPSYSKWYHNDNFISSSFDLEDFVISNTGTDTIKLVIKTCWGIDSLSKTVTVYNPTSSPTSNFKVSKNIINTSEMVKFYDLSGNGAAHWKWTISPAANFKNDPLFFFTKGDTVRNPSVTFNQEGNYKVCLIATNLLGSDTLCRENYIKVKDRFGLCKDDGSSDLNGDIFDMGGLEGNYSDNQYCTFLINPCANEVNLTFKDFSLAKGDYFRVYDGVDNKGQKLWDTLKFGLQGIGNGLDINDPGFNETYKAISGSIFIELVSDSSLNSRGFHAEWVSTKSTNSAPLNPDFTLLDTICISDTAFFTNTTPYSTNHFPKFHWDLDGDRVYDTTGKNAVFTYPNTGTYQVKLTAISCGGDSTITKNITVVPPWHRVAVKFEADNYRPVMNSDIVQLKSTSFGCIDYYEWVITPQSYTIEKGNLFSPDPEVSVVFKDAVCYNIELVVYNSSYSYSAKKTCFVKPYSYCVPVVKTLSSDIGISKVQLGNIYKLSDCGTTDYMDYSREQRTNIERGNEYTVSIYRKTTDDAMNRKIWIDYNQDGDFTDSLELVAMETAAKTIRWDATFKVPGFATLGATRMRIGVSYGNMANEPCGVNYFGEFEDYKVVILPDQTGPVIILNGPDTIDLEQCHPYAEAGATATDNVEGDISSQITITGNVDASVPGNYQINYEVSDSSGNEAKTVYRTVIVGSDAKSPQIALNGPAIYNIMVNTGFTDSLYTATDTCSGLDTVIISSNLDTTKVGIYEIVYTAYDKAGNVAMVTRTINVVDTVKPEITSSAGSVIEMDVFTILAEPVLRVTDNYYTEFTINRRGSYFETFKNGYASVLGNYSLIYDATDGSDNTDSIAFEVRVLDRESPEINLIGNTWIELCRFAALDSEADSLVVWDNYDASPDVVRGGSYITEYLPVRAEGNYELVYMVTDQSGNTSKAYRYISVVDCQSDIEEIVFEEGVAIYPNPNTGRFRLEFSSPLGSEYSFRILNNLGQEVMFHYHVDETGQRTDFDMEGVPVGIYMVELQNDSKKNVFKIQVVK